MKKQLIQCPVCQNVISGEYESKFSCPYCHNKDLVYGFLTEDDEHQLKIAIEFNAELNKSFNVRAEDILKLISTAKV